MRIGTIGRIISSSAMTDRLDVVAASQMIGLETALVDAAAAARTDAPAASGIAAGAEGMKGRNGSALGFGIDRVIFLLWRRVACILWQLGTSHLGR